MIKSQTPEYKIWHMIRGRCNNPCNSAYPRYGGANPPIIVEFDTFEQFYAEIGPRPSPDHTIDRYPNCNGNYGYGNIRWATIIQQNRNLKSNVYLTYNGITKLLVEWAEELGINAATLRERIKNGWSIERALTEPLNKWVHKKAPKHGAMINCKCTAEHRAWSCMRDRCRNPNNSKYSKYGGANPPIIVVPEWDDFEQFLKDVGPRPGPNYSLDRHPDKAGNYGPGNTRWATKKEQARNTKSNCLLELDGIIKPLIEWSELYKIKASVVRNRLDIGWNLFDALTMPIKELMTLKLNDIVQSIDEWSIMTGIDAGTIRTRKRKGWSDERTLTQPVQKHKNNSFRSKF